MEVREILQKIRLASNQIYGIELITFKTSLIPFSISHSAIARQTCFS